MKEAVCPDLCEKCGGETRVVETRHTEGYVRRRRECLTCGERYTTIEVRGEAAAAARMVQEADRLEGFFALPKRERAHACDALEAFIGVVRSGLLAN